MTYDELCNYVSNIPSNFNEDTTQMFYKFIPTLPEGKFMDFGTGYGRSVVLITKLNPNLDITTIDTAEPYINNECSLGDYKNKVKKYLLNHDCLSVRFKIANSLTFPWKDELVGLNIDSGHFYKQTKDEIIRWVPFVKKGGLIFLDDYLVERVGVKRAVDELIKSFPNKFEDLNPNGMCCVFRKLY